MGVPLRLAPADPLREGRGGVSPAATAKLADETGSVGERAIYLHVVGSQRVPSRHRRLFSAPAGRYLTSSRALRKSPIRSPMAAGFESSGAGDAIVPLTSIPQNHPW